MSRGALHAWTNSFCEMIVSSLGRYDSMDENTLDGKSYDMARILIRTTSWEFINRIVKVKVNGVFYNNRLIEEPSLVFESAATRHNSKGKGDSSSSNSLSWSNFSLGSGMENLIEEEEELFLQQLSEEQQVQSKDKEVGDRHISLENEKGDGSKEQPIIDNEVTNQL